MGCSASKRSKSASRLDNFTTQHDAADQAEVASASKESGGTAGSVVAQPQKPRALGTAPGVAAMIVEDATGSTSALPQTVTVRTVAPASAQAPSATPAAAALAPANFLAGRLAKYQVLEQVGAGAYAEVRKARVLSREASTLSPSDAEKARALPEYVAIKIIDVEKMEGGRAAIEREVRSLSAHAVQFCMLLALSLALSLAALRVRSFSPLPPALFRPLTPSPTTSPF